MALICWFDDWGGGVCMSMAESILMQESNPELVEQCRERLLKFDIQIFELQKFIKGTHCVELDLNIECQSEPRNKVF